MNDLISVKEYAKINNISVQAVYQRIAKNSVKFQKIGSVFLIKKEQ
jgi:excisionase family DNA binding protein